MQIHLAKPLKTNAQYNFNLFYTYAEILQSFRPFKSLVTQYFWYFCKLSETCFVLGYLNIFEVLVLAKGFEFVN